MEILQISQLEEEYTAYLRTNVYEAGMSLEPKTQSLVGTLLRFNRSLKSMRGAVGATKHFIKVGESPKSGFLLLKDMSRLDLSLEAVLLAEPKFHGLFDASLIEECRSRLEQAGDSAERLKELKRRKALWDSLDNPRQVAPSSLQGWRDLKNTTALTPEGVGIAVRVLHLNKHYINDMADEYLLYHFPENQLGLTNQKEIRSLKYCLERELPIFVISKSSPKRSMRDVRLGYINSIDTESKSCLIEFRDTPVPKQKASRSFHLKAEEDRELRSASVRERCHRFRSEVGERTGMFCAVCSVALGELLESAHICPVHEEGSNHPENGMMLCRNHHRAFDRFLFSIDPETHCIEYAEKTKEELQIEVEKPKCLQFPHTEALNWHWECFQKKKNKLRS